MTKPDDTMPADPNRPEADAFLRQVALEDLVHHRRGAGVAALGGRMGGG